MRSNRIWNREAPLYTRCLAPPTETPKRHEMFSPNANGVGGIEANTGLARTPLALRLNVETSYSWLREV